MASVTRWLDKLFNTWPFTALKICPIVFKICPSIFQILPVTEYTLNSGQMPQQILPKRQNFAKMSHWCWCPENRREEKMKWVTVTRTRKSFYFKILSGWHSIKFHFTWAFVLLPAKKCLCLSLIHSNSLSLSFSLSHSLTQHARTWVTNLQACGWVANETE